MASSKSTIKACQSCELAGRISDARYICLECLSSRRYFCLTCNKGHSSYHASASHRVLEIEEYDADPTKYKLVGNDSCEDHKGEPYKLVCRDCNQLLCALCPHDAGVTCPQAAAKTKKGRKGSNGLKHVTEVIEKATARDKEELEVSVKRAHRHAASAESVERQLQGLEDETSVLLKESLTAIHEAGDDWHAAVDTKVNTLCDQTKRYLTGRINEIKGLLLDTQCFIENNRNDCLLAKAVVACPIEVEVHVQATAMISRLEQPLPFLTPIPSQFKFVPISADEGETEWDNVVGTLHVPETTLFPKPAAPSRSTSVPSSPSSLFSSLPSASYSFLPLLDSKKITIAPDDVCAFHSHSNVWLEAFPRSGLYLVNGESRTKVEDSVGHMGVCMDAGDEGEALAYSTRYDSIFTYSCPRGTHELGSTRCLGAVTLEGAKLLAGLSLFSPTRRLAVVDTEVPRITVTAADSGEILSILRAKSEGVFYLGFPLYITWCDDGTDVVVTDSGSGDGLVEPSAARIRISPPTVVWRRALKKPWNVGFACGLVYVSHVSSSQVTVLSAEDGKVKKVISTESGEVHGVREGTNGGVVMACYK